MKNSIVTISDVAKAAGVTNGQDPIEVLRVIAALAQA